MTEEDKSKVKEHRIAVADQIGSQLLTGDPLACPECSERLVPVEGRPCVFDCSGCGLTGTIVVQHTKDEKDYILPEEEPGDVTPQMIHNIFWRMLHDTGGITVKGAFFKDAPVDQKFECQYDEVNDVYRFFVRTQRNKKKIVTPNRKVIT